MSLTTRLDKIEAALGGDDEPGLLIVLEDDDGTWRANGVEVDKATVGPGTRVVILSRRADGPQ